MMERGELLTEYMRMRSLMEAIRNYAAGHDGVAIQYIREMAALALREAHPAQRLNNSTRGTR